MAAVSSVVLVTPYFWPDVAASVPLLTSLAQDLARAKHTVTVLTSRPYRVQLSGAVDPGLEDLSGLRVVRLRNPFARYRGGLWKLLEYSWFSLAAIVRLAGLRGLQVCFVSSNPPLLPLLLVPVCRLRRVRLLYNLQDLFPASAVAAGLMPQWVERLLRPLECWTYALCDVVVTISDSFSGHVRKVAPSARVVTVPNWVDTSLMHPVPHPQNRFRTLARLNARFVALYAGNMGYLQDLSVALDTAGLLLTCKDILFVFVGEGPYRERLETDARARGLDNCLFFGFQPHALVSHVYSAGDIGLVLMRKGSGKTSIPSKTWVIMACGRPVLAACDGDSELASIIRDVGAGIVVEPGNAEELSRAVIALHRDRSRAETMGRAGRAYVQEKLSRGIVTRKYDALITELGRREGLDRPPQGERA